MPRLIPGEILGLVDEPDNGGATTLFLSLESVVLVALEPSSELVRWAMVLVPCLGRWTSGCDAPRRRCILDNLLPQLRPVAAPLADLLSWHIGGSVRGGPDVADIL